MCLGWNGYSQKVLGAVAVAFLEVMNIDYQL